MPFTCGNQCDLARCACSCSLWLWHLIAIICCMVRVVEALRWFSAMARFFFESASIGSDKWRPTGYLNVFSTLTQWLQWSNVCLLFLSLFLPCHPITTQFLGHHRHPCPFQPKITHVALRGPCRCHRHTDGYFTTTCHALRSSCTSPAFRKGHSIAAKLGWRSLKYRKLQP